MCYKNFYQLKIGINIEIFLFFQWTIESDLKNNMSKFVEFWSALSLILRRSVLFSFRQLESAKLNESLIVVQHKLFCSNTRIGSLSVWFTETELNDNKTYYSPKNILNSVGWEISITLEKNISFTCHCILTYPSHVER